LTGALDFARVHRGPGTLLDISMETLVACFGLCAGVAALCWLPMQAWRENSLYEEDMGALLRLAATQVLPEAVSILLCCRIIGAQLLGEPVGNLFVLFLRALPSICICLIPGFLLVNVSIVCCFPYFILMWFMILLPPILVFETIPGGHGILGAWVHAVPRARRLALGWRTLVRFLLWFLVVRLVFGTMLSLVNGAWAFPEFREEVARLVGTQGDGLRLIFILINAFLSGISTALLASAATVHYFDLRARKEGFDLELRLQIEESRLRGDPA